MKRYLYTDPRTRKEVTIDQNNDGSTVIHQEQRFDGLMRLNKQMNNDWRRGDLAGNTQRHMAHVAEIPNVVYNHLLEKLGPIHQNQKAWKAWLNDHQNRDFRTGGGHI
ncbi:MAG: hypothetical protein DWQ28_06465 [Proteobacteria bacterium]|nr:MAG: hypothetical protein DWQ28_06160 [Pseudomonadota bacterium]REJ67675.1 MAG: hypothetical protein DWQ28_06465 [Pseudomonadota bacterium]|tara:strand:- start:904 stop:1227 length:324 start_codon:yes stop_codon:yes gene_type:complete